jgi:isoamylase
MKTVHPGIPGQRRSIYELHVRGLTIHPSSGVEHPGTYRGLMEKIPYFKELGVTAVELMPVQEFNEHQAALAKIRKQVNR